MKLIHSTNVFEYPLSESPAELIIGTGIRVAPPRVVAGEA
jgi:hypothetical protein